MTHKGQIPVVACRRSARGQLFPAWPACLTRLHPGILTCGPQEKKTSPEKQTREARKKQMPPLHGAYLPPARKKQMPPRKKKEPQRANPCYRVRAQRPRAAFSLLAGLPHQTPPRKSYLRASRKKQAQKNKPRTQEKNKSAFVFFKRQSDGKPTIKLTFPNID